MANSINVKPGSFSDYLKLVNQAREQLSLQATHEGTRVAMEIVDAAIESGFLSDADAGTAAITPSDTGLAPNKYLATGPMAPDLSRDPALKAVDSTLGSKVAVEYDEDTQKDKEAKDKKREEHEKAKRK